MLLLAPGAAHAAPPEQWADAPGVTSLQFLLVLVLVPGGLFVAIALLSLLPSMISGSHGYQPGGVWRTEAEWFGGPREGLERVDHDQPAALESSGERGGASGSW